MLWCVNSQGDHFMVLECTTFFLWNELNKEVYQANSLLFFCRPFIRTSKLNAAFQNSFNAWWDFMTPKEHFTNMKKVENACRKKEDQYFQPYAFVTLILLRHHVTIYVFCNLMRFKCSTFCITGTTEIFNCVSRYFWGKQSFNNYFDFFLLTYTWKLVYY